MTEHVKPKLFVATKAFIVHDGKILLLRESTHYQDGTQIGKFDVPGGRVQPGERFDEGLIREIREETGLTVRVGKPFFVGEWRPIVKGEPWQIVGIFFACEADTDAVALSEDHAEYVWAEPRAVGELEIIPNLLPVFDAWLAANAVGV
jgi:8-oxo-dGTP diphosphatase